MLPVGYLGPAPGWGKARQTRLTHGEQRTLLTLWSIFRSPLMIGANLPFNDAWTTVLLTNPEVLDVDQHSKENHPVISSTSTVVWMAKTDPGDDNYVAVFNVDDHEQEVHYTWKDLGLNDAKYNLRDVWEHQDHGAAESLSLSLPPHECALYRLSK
jgi:hypothetical protein